MIHFAPISLADPCRIFFCLDYLWYILTAILQVSKGFCQLQIFFISSNFEPFFQWISSPAQFPHKIRQIMANIAHSGGNDRCVAHLKLVIKDNGNHSTGEWMQNPEKGCVSKKSEVASPLIFFCPLLRAQFVKNLLVTSTIEILTYGRN